MYFSISSSIVIIMTFDKCPRPVSFSEMLLFKYPLVLYVSYVCVVLSGTSLGFQIVWGSFQNIFNWSSFKYIETFHKHPPRKDALSISHNEGPAGCTVLSNNSTNTIEVSCHLLSSYYIPQASNTHRWKKSRKIQKHFILILNIYLPRLCAEKNMYKRTVIEHWTHIKWYVRQLKIN